MLSSRWHSLLDYFWRTFLAGLATLLPIAITVYAVWWLAAWAERFFGQLVRVILPAGWYVPGIGVVIAIGAVFLFGVFLNAWLVSRLVTFGERLLERIPLVKTIYTGLRDLLRFVSRDGRSTDLKHVVSIEIQPGVHMIGFVTDQEAGRSFPELARSDDDPLVTVYLPLGYQVGGHTLYLPASRLTELDISIEEAMRVALTAGVNKPYRAGNSRSGADQGRDGP